MSKKSKKINIPQKDEEMHLYLSEIRQKQEGLIAKLRQDSLAAQTLTEQPLEESIIEPSQKDSQIGKGLKQRRNLKPAKKPPTKPTVQPEDSKTNQVQ